MITKKNFDFSIYIMKSLFGVVIGLIICHFYPVFGSWCLLSIVLVITPERNDSTLAAVNRIKANVVGAAVGLLLCYFSPLSIFMICLGIALSMVICEMLKLQSATRSASVAILIITTHQPGPHFWDIALERSASVIVGCLIGVAVTFIFHYTFIRYGDKLYNWVVKTN